MQPSDFTAPARIIPTPPPPWTAWEDLMRLALGQAALAEAAGEVPVGALVVGPDGLIIGTGHNAMLSACDPSAHAEINALRQACLALGNYRLNGCVLVVTLEPCLMCVGAMAHARLSGLVYGAYDPKAGAVISCMDGLEQNFLNHRVWHCGGILAEECGEALTYFFSSRRKGRRA